MFGFIDDDLDENINCDAYEDLENIPIDNDEFCQSLSLLEDSTCDNTCEGSTINSDNSLYNNIAIQSFCSSPYESGFDEDHPLPTYDELRNAGFTDFEAKQITYHTYTVFSERELFEVLYSENSKEAYDAMMHKKLNTLDDRVNRIITSL